MQWGSSPLTRGKQSTLDAGILERRLIPAHAGKTQGCPYVGISEAAHPRSRGENSSYALRARMLPGSSPLTRGKHLHTRTISTLTGLIPAHAGKTWWRVLGCRG